jgi:hypothetical protein
MAERHGIMREHLLKSLAEKLSRLQVAATTEMDIIKLFNCAPFFDETLL